MKYQALLNGNDYFDEYLDQMAGRIEKGNINLYDRPMVKMDDGRTATVFTIGKGVEMPDGSVAEALIPTVSDDGRIMDEDEAWEQFRKTGRHFGIFDTPENATNFAKLLSALQGKIYLEGLEEY